MTSRHGEQDNNWTDRQPFRPPARHNDIGQDKVVSQGSVGPQMMEGGSDKELLKGSRRVSREMSRGLVSRPTPSILHHHPSKNRSRSPMNTNNVRPPRNNGNANQVSNKPALLRKPNAHQKQVIDNVRNPAPDLKLPLAPLSSRFESPFPDDRAPPRSMIITEEDIRPEPKLQVSKSPWSLLPHLHHQDESVSSLSQIDTHFQMLAQMDSQERQQSLQRDGSNNNNLSYNYNQTSGRSQIDRELPPDHVQPDFPQRIQSLETPQHEDGQSYWGEEQSHQQGVEVTARGGLPLGIGGGPFQPYPSGSGEDNRPPDFGGDPLPYDYFEFADLCIRAGYLRPNVDSYTDEDYAEHDRSWDDVRRWLQHHGQAEIILPYLELVDEHEQSALHHACRRQPPHDVIFHLIQMLDQSNRLDILYVRDSHGRTPIHLACANSAPPDTLRELAHWSRVALLAQDTMGLTPLHNALIGPFRKFPDLIDLLASTGAAEVTRSDLQTLPLHYACVFGATEETLHVLRDQYKEGLIQPDAEGRTPLHWALLSCKQAPEAAPLTVRWLLSEEPHLVNMAPGNTPDPIVYLLAEVINKNKKSYSEAKMGKIALVRQDAAKQCFKLLLNTKSRLVDPDEHVKLPTAVFQELRRAPKWIFPIAIMSPKVQDVLDRKMKSRFPTVVLMLDLYMQAMIMIAYIWNVEQSLDKRGYPNMMDEALASTTAGQNNPPALLRMLERSECDACITLTDLGFLYLGGTYFLLRELVQIISLIWSKSVMAFLQGWVFNLSDWLDITYIVTIFIWATILNQGSIDDVYAFSNAAALSAGILWMKLFMFLRTISFDFSVFVSGVLYVLRRLVPYMILLIFFLAAFTQIFNTLFISDADYGCVSNPDDEMTPEDDLEALQCFWQTANTLPFCSRWESFLKVYTMFLGEVDERDFAGSGVATFFFIVFMLLMVILLANVLIAIVTGYYKQVQDGRGILVFYTDRLYFLAEVDSIKEFPILRRTTTDQDDEISTDRARHNWQMLCDTVRMRQTRGGNRWRVAPEKRSFNYEEDTHFWNGGEGEEEEEEQSQLAMLCSLLVRAVGALVLMFGWFLCGLATVGLAWPPQIREWFFSNTKKKRSLAETEQEREQNREKEEKHVTEEMTKTKEEFHDALVENRKQLAIHRASIVNMKFEITKEMRRLKIKTQQLLEVFDSADSDDDSGHYSAD